MTQKKRDIIILAGGESGERDVSLDSARAIARTLHNSGNRVRVIDTLNGTFLPDGFILETAKATSEKYSLPESDGGTGAIVLAAELARARADEVDVIFNALHGGYGENGHISALLDLWGIPYTGSPMAASAIAMNKDVSKRIMRTLNIPTADWRTYAQTQQRAAMATNIISQFNLPFIIKPVDGGSTVGLSLVENTAQLPEALDSAFAVSDTIMAETYLRGREITISLLNGLPLPPVEIKPTHKVYDYTCKYTKGKSQYFCPADIDEEISAKLSRDAARFYDTIGCRGYARVDFIVGESGEHICLELNTLPGMTELSLFPMAAREAGLPFDELLEKLCDLAMADE